MSDNNEFVFSQQKLEALYNLYLNAFDNFKKIINKKDKNFESIRDKSATLREQSQNFGKLDQLYSYSLTLVEPFDKCSTKGMEVILNSMEEILKNNLMPPFILQKMVEKLIIYMHKYFQINEIDFKVDAKILKICEMIYSNQYIFIHNDNLKNIIKIYLRIYLSSHHTEVFQSQTQKTLKVLSSKMIENMSVYNIPNKNVNELNKIATDRNLDDNQRKYMLQLNEFNFVSKKYTDFLLDLIEIQSKIGVCDKSEDKKDSTLSTTEVDINNNDDIISKYISIIQQANNDEAKSSLIKAQLEELKLNELNLEYVNEENGNSYKIGKYGWCILCRKTADNWSDILQFPVCSNKACESEFHKCLCSIYARSDFLNMLIYLSTTSTLGSMDEMKDYSNTSNEVNFLCRQFCLENIKEMIEKSYDNFKNDENVIIIIKEIFKDALLKNTFSSKIRIFQLSLEIFISIIKAYREHLKDQIEIFFVKVLLSILESENFGFVFKDAILDALLELVEDCSFFVEIYVNYDCDVNCPAVFSELINLLTKIMNGLYRKSKYQNTFKPLQENALTNKTLDFLNKFIFNLNKLVETNEKKNQKKEGNNVNLPNDSTTGDKEKGEDNTTKEGGEGINKTYSQEEGINNLIDVKDKINKNLKIKKLLEKAIDVFNIGKSSSECLKFLQKEKMVFNEPAFLKVRDTYIDDINNNTIKNDYSKLLSPEEHTIISEMTSEELSVLDVNKKTNIMQTPFISTINPLVYFIINNDREKLTEITCDDYIAFEMARFIRTNLKELIRERVGDYLCSGKPFNIKVLTYFINSFDFEGNSILDAMRILFAELPLSGEAQVIDRVVQTFGEKFHRQNPNELNNPDFCYYLAFSLLQLNTDLHREEVEKKMTLKEFIDALNLSTGNEKINPKYLERLYNEIQNNPLVIPGQKLSGMNKNKKELLQEERKTIMKTTMTKLNAVTTITNNYITNIVNDNVRQLLDFSWSNFFSIYSQLLADDDNEKIVHSCVENILIMARTCGILKLNTVEEAYVNSVLNMTSLVDNREINARGLQSLRLLINYIINSGQYIRTGWLSILQLISRIDYFLETDNETIMNDIKNNRKMKNFEKEINMTFQKKEVIIKNIPDGVCDGIFSKTDKFDEDAIINFIICLCNVSKQELTEYYTPRVFSLHKLVEVADFNIFRIQVQWVKIWKLISEHLVDVISNSQYENIWKEALESLRQTICKLLQKQDLSIYNFQMDFFKPFEIIFSQTKNAPARGETIINYIYYIVGSFGMNIHSGWIVIFRILKSAFQRGEPRINEDLKNILLKIYENSSIIINANVDVFRGYIECLCYMYLDKSLKRDAFETILNLLAKIMNEMDIQIEGNNQANPDMLGRRLSKSVLQLPGTNKKFDFLKIFFYGFDDIIPINVVEHLNLLFEIVAHNKDLIFSKDCHSFLYMYYSYFKPHLVILLLSRFLNRFSLFEEINDNSVDSYDKYKDGNSFDVKTENIRINLIDSLSKLIEDFSSKESMEYERMFMEKGRKPEHKRALIGFLREIKEGYTKEEMTLTIKKKLLELSNLDDHNYEDAIEMFLEKFKRMYKNIKEQDGSNLRYNYFYEDLFITIYKLLIVNNNSDILFKILLKILSSYDPDDKDNSPSEKCIEEINKVNNFLLVLLSNSKVATNEEKLHKLVNFSLSFSGFLLSFMQHYNIDLELVYKLYSKIFNKLLQIDLENKFERFRIVTSSSTIDMLIRIQGIQSNILDKISDDNIKKLYDNESSTNKITNLHKIFNKYNLANEGNSLMNGVLQFALEKNLPRFMKYLNSQELKSIFFSLLDFTDSINIKLRKTSKTSLNEFFNLNLISFNGYKEDDKEKENEKEKEKVKEKEEEKEIENKNEQ